MLGTVSDRRSGVRLVRCVLVLVGLMAPAGTRPALAADTLVVGSWATYQWTSSLTEEVPVLVRQAAPGGSETWTVTRERVPPVPLFVTYSVVRGDARRYVLQIVTAKAQDGPPLAVTQVTVDRATGKALSSVTQRPQGTIATPESGLRPFQTTPGAGSTEEVAVPAGRFAARRVSHPDGVAWVSDQVPVLGLVKGTFGSGELALVQSGGTGARDRLQP
jgi:hypothetical protein